MINTIIFDMDGLLIDSEPFWAQAEIEVFATVGIHLTHEQCEQTTGIRMAEVVQLRYDRQPWDTKIHSLEHVENMILDRVIQLVQANGQLCDGVAEFLNICHQQNITMAICSSSRLKFINAVVDKFNLGHYFQVLYSGEYEPYAKPHPACYLNTIKKLGVTPEMCLVFEDSITGAIAGKASGAKTIAIPSIPSQKQHFQFCHDIYDSMADVTLDKVL